MKDLFGHEVFADKVKDQLREIMLDYPETIDDEDLLAAHWLGKHHRLHEYFPEWGVNHLLGALVHFLAIIRKADIPRRRRELRDEFPYSEEEEARRQKAARR